MRTIGLLGGMSWESSILYYRAINEEVRARLGGLHSAQTLMYSVDFAVIERLQSEGRWDEAGALLARAARSLEQGGADFLVVCTNTMHKVAPAIEAAIAIPLLHIADPTGEAIARRGFRRVGLLGTRFTMEEPFYRARLAERFGLDVRTPGEADRARIHAIIFDELCRGRVEAASRDAFRAIVDGLARDGAEAVILGCTEIGMSLTQADAPLPLFDTTVLHAHAAVDRALAP